MYPEYEVIQQLWLYRSVIPVVYTAKEGDNLSDIATQYGTNVDKILELNPSINRKTGLINVGQEIVVDNITTNVNMQRCGDIIFDSNAAKKMKNGTLTVTDIVSEKEHNVIRNSNGTYSELTPNN